MQRGRRFGDVLMKKYAAFAAAIAMAAQLVAPAHAAGSAGPLKDSTMMGWQRTSEAAAMAYFKMPLQQSKTMRGQPRAGLMITSPRNYRAGTPIMHASAPGIIDLGITGQGLRTPWNATLLVQDKVAWASNPDALPQNTKHLFESGASWLVVGAISAAIIGGVILLSEEDK
jgi:hypothetical protein